MSRVLSLRATGDKILFLSIDEMSRKAFINPLKSRSEVAAVTLEMIKKNNAGLKQSWTG
jgi:hypothetical protein